MAYRPPGNVPEDSTALAAMLGRELEKIANEFEGSRRVVKYQVLYAVPEKPRQGITVYADGSNWNPGLGEGLYRYDGTTWNFLG